jgi:apolipoprotein N-acyltransferase
MKNNGSSLFCALIGGALTALAFPKFGWSFLAWISLIPLFLVLSRSGPKMGFLYGLAAGAAFYGVLLYWIPDVPAHYGNLPMWLSLVVYLLFILFLGIFWGLFGMFFSGTRRAFPAAAYIMAPFYWVSFEYALTYVLTGFPWGLLGYSQYKNIPFIQSASWTGVYGISFVCVLIQATFVLAMRRRVKAPFFAALALLAGIHAAGWMSLKPLPPGNDSFTAAVIQGNVSSETSWDRLTSEETTRIFEDHLELSREARRDGAGLIIWPESTVPLCFSCPEGFYTRYSEALYDFARDEDATLLLGTNETTGSPSREEYHNTAFCLHPDRSSTRYFKTHLVPFGEYTPWRNIFGFIDKITNSVGDLTPGNKIILHEYAGHPFGSPICYEIIFPALVRRFTQKGATFLVTITNDGWYGNSSAPYQHFAIAAFRAVENRRFLLRAATTGISGVVDPFGRIVVRSPLMVRTRLSGTITPLETRTFYAVHGDVFAWACLTLSLIFFIMSIFKHPRERDSHEYNRKNI